MNNIYKKYQLRCLVQLSLDNIPISIFLKGV